jgi:hypothetical protein
VMVSLAAASLASPTSIAGRTPGVGMIASAAPPAPASAETDEQEPETAADSAPPAPTAPNPNTPTTFESLTRAAAPMADLGTLLGPFAGKCDGEKRELDRMRCRTARAYLRKTIPQRSFWAVVDDPDTLSVSEYDGAIKGYHLTVSGCLACARPVLVGRTNERRLITVKTPEKQAASLRAAVQLNKSSVGFDNLGEAKSWFEQNRVDLRTQFVFRPTDAEWRFGTNEGYAMELLGMRVFNRCTGEVLVSRPASTRNADMPNIDEGCRQRESKPDASGNKADADLPAQMSRRDIQQAMANVRPQVFACFEKFKVPGLAQFDFTVAGNGTVATVRLSGAFYGTPTGVCLLEAAQNAHFPRFSRERQQFVYPFFLRN